MKHIAYNGRLRHTKYKEYAIFKAIIKCGDDRQHYNHISAATCRVASLVSL